VVTLKVTGPDGKIRTEKIPGDRTTEDCWFQAGLGMADAFYTWLSRSMLELPQRLDVVVARVDGTEATEAVGLSNAWPSAVGVTRVEPSAEGGVAFLRTRVSFEDSMVVDPQGLAVGSVAELPIDVSTLDVDVAGVDVDVMQVRNLMRSVEIVEIKQSLPNGTTRIVKAAGAPTAEPLVFGSASPDGADMLKDWYADVDDGGGSGIRGIAVTLSAAGQPGRVLTIEGTKAWVSESEPFPRADGFTRATLAVSEFTFVFPE
jgi:hypothetical protein